MAGQSRGRSKQGKRSTGHLQEDGWEEWGGYMAAKMHKLESQYPKDIDEENKTAIFKGVAIYVNGYTKPSSDELKRLVINGGGRYEHYLYKTRVTHIIATNLPYSKIRDLKGSKVVKPDWITDSVKEGRLLSYIPYQLYTSQGGKQQGMETFSSSTTTHHSRVPSVTMTTTSEAWDAAKTLIDSGMNFEEMLGVSDEEDYLSDAAIQMSDKVETSNAVKCLDDSDNFLPDNNVSTALNLSSSVNEEHFTGKSSASCDTKLNISNDKTLPDKRQIAKAGEPAFLSEFYSNSRLHHLSTWKSDWCEYVNKLQSKGSDFPGRQRLLGLTNENVQATAQRLHQTYTRSNSSGKPKRVIMHIDMDCFFVSVGLKKRPDLKGKPIAVTHSRGEGQKNPTPGSDLEFERRQWELRRQQGGKKGKQVSNQDKHLDVLHTQENNTEENIDQSNQGGHSSNDSKISFHSMAEIASCSYEARKAGVRNGMFMGKARQLCPNLQTIPYDFEGYQEVSRQLYDTIASYTHDIEAVSCDELLVDCTDLLATTGADPLDFAALLRQEIFKKTGCTASAGMGPNILLAKMATRKAKPNGHFYLPNDQVLEFIADQSIQNLPGVGWSMSKKCKSISLETCGDLQKVSLSILQKEFGPKTGQSLYNYARGLDDRPIKMGHERKSVSAEINYGIRFKSDGDAEKFMLELSEEVHNRLKNIDRKGKTITLKLMVRRPDAPVETAKFMGHGICNSLSKSVTLPLATDDYKIINKECLSILRNQKIRAGDLRGIGIQIQKLESAVVGNQNSKNGAQSILNFTVAKPVSPNMNLDQHSSIDDKNKTNGTIDDIQGSLVDSRDKNGSVSTSNSKHSTNSSDENIHRIRETDNHSTNNLFKTSVQDNSPLNKNSSTGIGRHVTKVDCLAQSSFLPDTSVKKITQNNVEENSQPLAIDLEEDMTQGEEGKDFLGGYCHNIVDDLSRRRTAKRFLPPLPTLPDITGSPEIKVGTDLPAQCDFFPSPSQIDPDVMKELPFDIRKQIEKEMAARNKKVPTRNFQSGKHQLALGESETATMISDNSSHRKSTTNQGTKEESPGCSHWSDSQNMTNRVKKAAESNSHEPIVPLPSLSQIDPDVMKELPVDIRQQIEKEMAARNKKVPTRNFQSDKHQLAIGESETSTTKSDNSSHRKTTSNQGTKEDAPGCSHWSDSQSMTNQVIDTADIHSNDPIVPLPSLSQIDESCLNALPEELQKELRDAYAKQIPRNQTKEMASNQLCLQQDTSPSKKRRSPNKLIHSPSKALSPGRWKKNSPTFKIPRGKPGRGRPKKLNFQNSRQPKIDATVKGRQNSSNKRETSKSEPGAQISSHIESSVVRDVEEDAVEIIQEDDSCTKELTPKGSNQSIVSLCGAVTIAEVRDLIKEWLNSAQEPETEDLEVMGNYLRDLALNQNLEQIDLVIRFLIRHTKRLQNPGWIQALGGIIERLQTVVQAIYGCALKIFL